MNLSGLRLESTVIATAIALLAFAAPLIATESSAQAKPAAGPTRECQRPLVTGEEAVNIRGVSPAAACKVVLALGVYLNEENGYRKLYECAGATPRKPGRPRLLMHQFQGWKLKLVNGYGFLMYKPGASFRVTGTDFPINCS